MSCAVLPTIFAELCGVANPPGISSIHIIEHEFVEAIPAASAGVISTDVTLTATKYWRPLPFSMNTAKFDVEVAGDAPDYMSVTPKTDFSVPKQRVDVFVTATGLLGRPIMVLVTLANGDIFLLGDLTHKVYMSTLASTSGAGGTDKSQTTFTFTVMPSLAYLPYKYTGEVVLS